MQSQFKFPDLSRQLSGAMEESPVILNGQKVLFDTKITLMPVEIQKSDS